MSDEFTAEETAAFEAMQADTAPEATETPEVTEETPPAPPAEEEKAEEAPAPEAEKAEAEPEPVKPPEGFVPHGAMHAERVKRQEIERQFQAMRQELEALKAQQKPAEPETVPDPVLEPEKYTAWVKQQANGPAEEIRKLREQWSQQQQREQLMHTIQAREQEFAKAHPDYNDAVNYIVNQRRQELSFFTTDEQAINAQVQADVLGFAEQAVRQGMNPAQAAYHYAKARGYKPAEKATAPAPASDAAAKVAALANAQKQTETLGSASGPANAGALTAEMLAGMSDAEFAKLSDDDIRRAMGG